LVRATTEPFLWASVNGVAHLVQLHQNQAVGRLPPSPTTQRRKNTLLGKQIITPMGLEYYDLAHFLRSIRFVHYCRRSALGIWIGQCQHQGKRPLLSPSRSMTCDESTLAYHLH
jgi:hypothetical protein